MAHQRYGPDILHEVNDDDLRKLNIPPGDVIRLKRAAPKWYNSPAAKRPRASFTDRNGDTPAPNTEDQRKIRFERVDVDGTGARTFWGPRMEPSEAPKPNDYYYQYFNEAMGQMVRVPDGWVPVEEGAGDEGDNIFGGGGI